MEGKSTRHPTFIQIWLNSKSIFFRQNFMLKRQNLNILWLSVSLTVARTDCDGDSSVDKENDLLWDPLKIQGWLKALCVGGWQDGWWISVELWAIQLLCQDLKRHIEKALFCCKHLSSGGGREPSEDLKSIERNLCQLRWFYRGRSRVLTWQWDSVGE